MFFFKNSDHIKLLTFYFAKNFKNIFLLSPSFSKIRNSLLQTFSPICILFTVTINWNKLYPAPKKDEFIVAGFKCR